MKYKLFNFLLLFTLGFALLQSCSSNSDGNGNSTATLVPVSPSNLAGIAFSTTQINLTWADNSTNETGFKIERKTALGDYAVIGTTVANIMTFSDTGLTPATTFTYRVYAYNEAGNSPTYSNEVNVLTNNTVTPLLSVNIGFQTWMLKNLDVSTYRNGEPIPQVTDPTAWAGLTTGAWCYYANDTANGTTYGKLYNWYAVNDPRGLAPMGWHVPSEVEWTSLITFLGGEIVAGGKMKSTGTTLWLSPNIGATNSSSFTALPGGFRNRSGTFNDLGGRGGWWSTWAGDATNASGRNLDYSFDYIVSYYTIMSDGFSVRCIRD